MNTLAPALAVGAMNNQQKSCCPQPVYDVCCEKRGYGGDYGYGLPQYESHREHWDTDRDVLRETGNIKQEIKDIAYTQQMSNDRYFYENALNTQRGFTDLKTDIAQSRFDMGIAFKDSAILNLENTKDILMAQANALKEIKEDNWRREVDMLKEKMADLRTRIPQPSYIPNFGPGHVPQIQNCYAGSCDAPGYGWY